MSSEPIRLVRHSVKDLSRHIGRHILLVILAIALFFSSFIAIAYQDLQSQVKRIDVTNLLSSARPTRADNKPVPDNYAGVAVNILVMGSDSREGANNIDDSDSGMGARSDTTMIMHVSADRSRIEVVSIPRDTMVAIPACTQADGSKTYAQSYAQFNSAFSFGAGNGTDTSAVAAGAACTINTVEQLTGLHIDEYVVVDFTGLQTMVNSLGGVTVYVDEDIDDADYSGLVLAAGCYTMDGTTALEYARVRHGVSDGSDTSRILRQQNLVAAMLRTAQTKNLLTNADDLYSFARSTLSTLTTSTGIGTLTTLAGLAQSISAIGMDNVHFITMPYATDPNNANRVVPASSATEVWNALINDQPVSTDVVNLQGNGQAPDAANAASDSTDSTDTSDSTQAQTDAADSSAATDSAADATVQDSTDLAAQCYASTS